MNDMTFDQWIEHGLRMRWIGPAVCFTHDGLPTTEPEDIARWEDGDDKCIHIVRLYDSTATADAVEANHAPSVWRKPQ